MPLPDRPRSRAVLIGTSTYQDHRRLPSLPAVANNLSDLRAALTDRDLGSFDAKYCTLIENPSDQREVATSLADIAATADDALLVYYSGHGVLGSPEHNLNLGLTTTDIDRPEYSSLPFHWVRNELLRSRAKTKVLILECCFSGRAIDDVMGDPESLVLGQTSVNGTYTLTATSANTAALAPSGGRYTAFSGELIELLSDGVSDGPAQLDLNFIYKRLNSRMTAKGWPTPKQQGTNNVHDLALARNPRYRAPSFTLRPAEWAKDSEGDQLTDLLLQELLTGQLSSGMCRRLVDQRVVVLNSNIDASAANRVISELVLFATSDPLSVINFYINSPGGSLSAAMAIHEAMTYIRPRVATWVIGLASGVAQLLLSAGAPGRRYALPHAQVRIRGPWVSDPAKLNKQVVDDDSIKSIVKIVAVDTGQPADRVRADLIRTRWFSPQEALEYGMIDQVVGRLNLGQAAEIERPVSED
ncbi:caspase, EACC1-associated type [Pseudonocardia spinosispora]|uniref:caspase, EACC1-associated type n=1 Tax=Pseudonocardia spinosispora TaxID=103441 RepID=UPI000A0641AE|nr:ATP-dependent Clp protease proteolytic subunit [Pseudonocardia spinosispora]